MKVLLVEDNRVAGKVAKFVLEQCHCVVDWVENGADALSNLQYILYNIVFMDIGLGDADGCDIIKTIRCSDGLNQSTFVVALTAHNDQEMRDQCFVIGANDFVVKPLTIERLQEVLAGFE